QMLALYSNSGELVGFLIFCRSTLVGSRELDVDNEYVKALEDNLRSYGKPYSVYVTSTSVGAGMFTKSASISWMRNGESVVLSFSPQSQQTPRTATLSYYVNSDCPLSLPGAAQ